MRPAAAGSRGMELDDFIRAYEAAWALRRTGRLEGVPPRAGPPALRLGAARGGPRRSRAITGLAANPGRLEDYRSSFPELFSDRESLHAITFEEYRLRRQAGENVTPAEYENRFGVDVTTWPSLQPAGGSR